MRVCKQIKMAGLLIGMMCVLVACGDAAGSDGGDANNIYDSNQTDSIDTTSVDESADGSNNEDGQGDNDKQGSSDSSDEADSSGVSYGELAEGDVAPDFAADLVSGEKFVLSENSGKVVLLNLWATWCGPCVEEMPAFEKLNSEYGDDVAIICVNCVESKDTVNAFVKENGYTFPIAYDLDGIITSKYPTQGIPYTLVIGKDGNIENIYLGSMGMEQQYETYKASIDEALSK